MISYVLTELHKRLPYHYSIEEDHLRMVFLMGEVPTPERLDSMDFVEELGFKFHSHKKLPQSSSGPIKWTQLEYHWKFVPANLPSAEAKFLKSFKEMSNYDRHKLVNKK